MLSTLLATLVISESGERVRRGLGAGLVVYRGSEYLVRRD